MARDVSFVAPCRDDEAPASQPQCYALLGDADKCVGRASDDVEGGADKDGRHGRQDRWHGKPQTLIRFDLAPLWRALETRGVGSAKLKLTIGLRGRMDGQIVLDLFAMQPTPNEHHRFWQCASGQAQDCPIDNALCSEVSSTRQNWPWYWPARPKERREQGKDFAFDVTSQLQAWLAAQSATAGWLVDWQGSPENGRAHGWLGVGGAELIEPPRLVVIAEGAFPAAP